MVQLILGGLLVVVSMRLVVLYKKYHTVSAAVAAVKAEVLKIEAEAKAEEAKVVARIKALL